MTPEERELTNRIRSIEDRLNRFPIRAVELLRPQAGDILLLTLPRNMSNAQRASVAESFRQAMSSLPDVRIACLPPDMAVRVVRAADIPEAEIKGPGFEHLDSPPRIVASCA